MDVWRVCVWRDGETDPAVNGHPLYVWPRQGRGRLDDPQHEYLVLYCSDTPEGAVAEYLGDYARWTPAVLAPPPAAPPGSVVALVRYAVDARVLDLDDAAALLDWGLRPSAVVSRERAITQDWARAVYDSGAYAGVSWWSYREPRWASCGLWDRTGVVLAGTPRPLALDDEAVLTASRIINRVVEE